MLHVDTYRGLKKQIIIKECEQIMLEIPSEFERFSPHVYQSLGAIYEVFSPFYLRIEVLNRLHVAQKKLQSLKSKYKLKIFDAYRPIEVQKFMIELDTIRYSKEIADKFWSPIAKDISLNPPPHSTGGALDLTIIDENNNELEMGTKIDEFVDKTFSNYFKDKKDSLCKENRDLLLRVMTDAGFVQLPTEWWHFSYGDQIWAIENNDNDNAKYGLI